MASISDYIKGLQADYAKNNIYSQLGSGILGADVNIKGGSPWTNLATNFVKGLLGGGLNQYGISENREYNAGINSVLEDTLAGRAVRPVAGLSEGELGDLISSVSIFDQGAKRDAALLQDIEFAKQKGTTLGDLKAKEEIFGDLNSPTNPANPNAKEIAEETKIVGAKQKAFDYIDKAYEQAEKLVGMKAAVPTQIGGNKDALDSFNAALTYQIDNTIGREVNDLPRELFSKWAPQWYDTPKSLQEKKLGFKQALESFTKPTPMLDRLGIGSTTTQTTTPTQPTQQQTVIGRDGKKYVFID